MAKKVAEARRFNGITSGQLIDGIDKVYADYRNRRISVVRAIKVVEESINGSSDKEIGQRLEFFRKEASEN